MPSALECTLLRRALNSHYRRETRIGRFKNQSDFLNDIAQQSNCSAETARKFIFGSYDDINSSRFNDLHAYAVEKTGADPLDYAFQKQLAEYYGAEVIDPKVRGDMAKEFRYYQISSSKFKDDMISVSTVKITDVGFNNFMLIEEYSEVSDATIPAASHFEGILYRRGSHLITDMREKVTHIPRHSVILGGKAKNGTYEGYMLKLTEYPNRPAHRSTFVLEEKAEDHPFLQDQFVTYEQLEQAGKERISVVLQRPNLIIPYHYNTKN